MIDHFFNTKEYCMNYIQRSIELNWPMLVVQAIFLVGGIALIVAGYKIKKKSKVSSVISISVGIVLTLVTLYSMFSTLVFRLNS